MIPDPWRGERITLLLERAHWQAEVWVDDTALGSQNSLSTPHIYDLGALAPGRHRITICVDHSLIGDVGVRASSVTDYTQTNWNLPRVRGRSFWMICQPGSAPWCR